MPKKIWAVFEKLIRSIRRIPLIDWIFVCIGLILAMLVRLSLHNLYTADFTTFAGCYISLQKMGVAFFKTGCEVYTPFYEYLLYIETILFPKISNTGGPKLVNILFDFITGWLIFAIVRLKYKTGYIPHLAMFAFLFTPTIILVSAGWGQFDSVYTAFLIACLYFILKDKGWLGCLMFGIALSIKLQAIALAPFILVLFMRKKVRFGSLFLVPAVYLALMVPALIAGRPLMDLLTRYFTQVNIYNQVTVNSPTFYAWLPNVTSNPFYLMGLGLAACIVFLFAFAVFKSEASLTSERLVLLAFLSSLIMPFFLPRMHERYFFPADVIAFVFAFYYFPHFFYAPIVVDLISFFSFQTYLFHTSDIPLQVLSLGIMVMIVLLTRLFIQEFFPAESLHPEPSQTG